MRILGIIAMVAIITGCVKTMANNDTSIDVMRFHDRRPGASAKELLSDSQFYSLEVEVQYMEGYKPEAQTIHNLRAFLETYLRKPAGITIRQTKIESTGNDALSKEGVLQIEKTKRTSYSTESRMSMYILFTNGSHLDNRILGMAYRNTSAVIFGGSVRNNSNLSGRLTRAELQTAVLLHEVGHMIGLVNIGDEAATRDAVHNHCDNPRCLMYHATETKRLSSILVKGYIPVLDSACIASIKANGGKEGFRPEDQ